MGFKGIARGIAKNYCQMRMHGLSELAQKSAVHFQGTSEIGKLEPKSHGWHPISLLFSDCAVLRVHETV